MSRTKSEFPIKSNQYRIRLTDDFKQKFDDACRRDGVSIASVLIAMMQMYINGKDSKGRTFRAFVKPK